MTNRQELIEAIAITIAASQVTRTRQTWDDLFEIQRRIFRSLAEQILFIIDGNDEPWVVDPYFLASMGPEDRFVGDPPMVTETEANHRREVLRLRAKYDKLKHEFDEYKMNVLAERPDVAEGLKRAAEAAERGETVRKQRYRDEGGHPPTDAEREIIAARRARREHEEKK